jgi:hypothetical protein
MRFLTLLLAGFLGGCASKVPDQLNMQTANARAVEQMRMRAVTSGDATSERGAEVLVPNKDKEFDPNTARLGARRGIEGRAAQTTEFQYVDRTRTRAFVSKDFSTKGAWMGNAKFATKEASTKTSWFARKSARTKDYETREARDASKSAATRALPGGDRPFLVQGRTQAKLDATGRGSIPFGTTTMGPSWSGDLKPLTIEDVKGLLNKN